MAKQSTGAKTWLIADSFLPEHSTGDLPSHESTCIVNVSRRPAKLKITVYFEDRDPLMGFEAQCPALRTAHVRLDRLKNHRGEMIPAGKSLALMVESNVNVVVQHTRLDTTQPALALMTTMGFPLR